MTDEQAGGAATSATDALERASSRSGEASVPVARGGRSSSASDQDWLLRPREDSNLRRTV